MAGNHKYADWNWNLGEPNSNGSYAWEQIHAAVLLDIRHELKRLNELFRCHNFLAVPADLRRIRLNTTKRRKRISK